MANLGLCRMGITVCWVCVRREGTFIQAGGIIQNDIPSTEDLPKICFMIIFLERLECERKDQPGYGL